MTYHLPSADVSVGKLRIVSVTGGMTAKFLATNNII